MSDPMDITRGDSEPKRLWTLSNRGDVYQLF